MPPFAALMLLAIPTLASVGLLAVWVGSGRGPWFARAAALGALIGAWLLIPAPEPAVVFTVQALLVAPIIFLARRWRDRSPETRWLQFTLRDLLLLTVVVAVVTATAVCQPKEVWTSWDTFDPGDAEPAHAFHRPALEPWLVFVLAGVSAGGVTLLATWLAFGRCRAWIRAAVLLAAFVAVGFVTYDAVVATWFSKHLPMFQVAYQAKALYATAVQRAWWIAVIPLTLLPLTTWLAVLVSWRSHSVRRCWQRGFVTATLLLTSAIVFVPPVASFVVLVSRPSIPNDPLPEDNGYATLCQLAERIGKSEECSARWFADSPFRPAFGQANELEDVLDRNRLQRFCDRNRATLIEAEAALSRECRVPVEYTRRYRERDSLFAELTRFRCLGNGFLCEARLAFLNGDLVAFKRHGLAAIRLANAVSRGGLLMDVCIGRIMEYRALLQLHHHVGSLTPESRRELARDLRRLFAERESFDSAWRRERIMDARAYGWYGRFVRLVAPIKEARAFSSLNVFALTVVGTSTSDAPYGLLLTELALENYLADHKTYPQSLAELTPEYLPEPIQDPYCQGGLIYRRKGAKDYVLHSVGPNGVDDGRKRADENAGPDFAPDTDDIWFWQKNPDGP